jgi:hypothetical protein
LAVDNLRRRGASLYHACQLKDFEGYLALDGVPAREALADAEVPFTTFKTDLRDRENRVWDKVFFNLSDLGRVFAEGGPWTPNQYGPIVLKFSPDVLLEAENCSLTLRSAGAAKFDRETEGVEVSRLNDVFINENAAVKREEQLRLAFSDRIVRGSPELNCQIDGGIASLANLRAIVVDPYTFADGRTLLLLARAACERAGFRSEVVQRTCPQARTQVYADLFASVAAGVTTLPTLLERDVSSSTKDWAAKAMKWDKSSFFFDRYASYLWAGTIDHVRGRQRPVVEWPRIAILEIVPPEVVISAFAAEELHERIIEIIEAALLGKAGKMASWDGHNEGTITFARVDTLRFDGFDGDDVHWSCGFSANADVRYEGLLSSGEDATDDVSGNVRGHVWLTFPALIGYDINDLAEAANIDELKIEEWPEAEDRPDIDL